MSEVPPPPATLDDPLPSPRPNRSWSVPISWAIILLVSAFVIISNVEPELKGREAATDSGSAEVQLTLAAKSAVGTKAMSASTAGSQPASNSDLATIQSQIDTMARSPGELVRAAILAGEISGAPAAQERLGSIARRDIPQELTSDIALLQRVYSEGGTSLDEPQRQDLIARYGYFGELALSHGMPDTDPLRSSVIARGKKTLAWWLATVLGGVIGLLLGLILFVVAIVLLATKVIKTRYTPRPDHPVIFLEMFAAYLISYVLLSILVSFLSGGKTSLAWSWVIAAAVPITLLWGLVRGLTWSDVREGLGWHTGRGWYIEMPLGIVGYLAGLPVIGAGILITLLLVRVSGAAPSHPILGESTDSLFNVLLLYSVASLWAPIIEETMFRGALLHHLRRRWNWLFSTLVVAVIFAAIHPQGWAVVPALASIAIVLAAIREWRGSLLAPMVAHGFHNGMLITFMVLIKSS